MEQFFEIQLDNGSKFRAKGEDTLNLRVGDFCIYRKDFYLDYAQVVKVYPLAGKAVDAAPDAPVSESEQGVTDGASGGSDVAPSGADSEQTIPPAPESVATAPDLPSPTEDAPPPPPPNVSECGRRGSGEIPKIQRKATVMDHGKANENTMRAKSILRTTQQFVERLNLPMKLINAHYSFDGKIVTVQFSAEGRVDFRELVKQLSQALNTRIELRQIGVRDETAIIGGISMCGRPLCCCQFLTDFASINVKMAKEQDLSLTPSTISGCCGRLKCCLKYEHEGYLELEKNMPRRGDCCECKDGRGRIVDRNLLTQKVTVHLDETGRTIVCPREEVNVVYPEKYKIRPAQAPKGDSSGSTQPPKGGNNRPDDRQENRSGRGGGNPRQENRSDNGGGNRSNPRQDKKR